MNKTFDYTPNNIQKLFDVYEQGFAPSQWVKNVKKSIYNKQAKSVVVYYDSRDNASTSLENVKSLVIQREPVNISMIRRYDQLELRNLFGYANGNYNQFDHSINIAMYMSCSVHLEGYGNEKKQINVLNVVAPALDSSEQPDFYKYFKDVNSQQDLDVGSITKRFTLIFNMIYECVMQHNNIEHIYLTGFGTGAFGNKEEWFIDGFFNSKLTTIKSTGKALYFWNYAQGTKIENKLNQYLEYKFVDYFNLQNYIHSISQEKDLKKCLFINAWDPWSIVGNGNGSDNSWDGQFGRRTNISVLSLPQFNKHIKYVDIKEREPKPVYINFNGEWHDARPYQSWAYNDFIRKNKTSVLYATEGTYLDQTKEAVFIPMNVSSLMGIVFNVSRTGDDVFIVRADGSTSKLSTKNKHKPSVGKVNSPIGNNIFDMEKTPTSYYTEYNIILENLEN